LSGVGECYSPYYSYEVKDFVSSLKDKIIGENPMNIARLTYAMGLGRTSSYMVNAISGIEIALWDLLGKILEVPVHTLLGGSHRNDVLIYADCHAGEMVTSIESYGGVYRSYTPEAYAENAKNVEKRGYSILKFDFYPPFPGKNGKIIDSPLNSADVRYCTEIVDCVRNALKDETGLAIDLGGGYSTADAIRLGKAFEPYNLEWLEDVVRGTNVEAMIQVTRSVSIPILCSSTQLRNMREDAREVITKQAARLLAIDFGNIGGLHEGRKIADLAELYFINIATHNIASPIGTVAAAQACATIPNYKALEHHAIGVEWWDDLVKDGPVIQDGYYSLNDRPGLGIELNEDEINNHLKKGENLFSCD
jgi:galactonate dehydratase